jgi:DNA repair protein RadA/Sms
MAKTLLKFVCQECGSWHSKWSGKCEDCSAWNTLVEEEVAPKKLTHSLASKLQLSPLKGDEELPPRHLSQNNEFDRVCGGGLVPGSVLLVGGDPGIGKSTLLLQVTSKLSHSLKCLYVSGEEGLNQIRLRAKRLTLENEPLLLASSTNLEEIIEAVQNDAAIQLIVIDSIQTLNSSKVESAPGSVTQVRTCAHELIQVAKNNNVILIFVGHVTKEGTLAGPRVLEHMVDTVLYFEGERHYPYRILRAVKNRFGPTDEIGIFNMCDSGLEEVKNPSELFLSPIKEPQIGMVTFAGLEGTRPLLSEVQALVAPSYLPSPRRTTVGWDQSRLSMVLAVLEARCGLNFGNKDVYLNIAGGLKINETAADFAVAVALGSALLKRPCSKDTIFFGEVGLGGEIRRVQHANLRLKEAEKLGFKRAFFSNDSTPPKTKLSISTFTHLNQFIDLLRNPA